MMKYKLVFLIVLGAAIASGVMGRLRRKRSVLVEFARMIECETGRPAGEYNGYGCWCGKGGHGKPVDDVDRCCFEHDNCYGKAAKDKCTLPAQIYWQWYYRTPCSGCYSALNNKCGQALCECDGEAARCFRRSHFHLHYKRYFKEQCYENHTIV